MHSLLVLSKALEKSTMVCTHIGILRCQKAVSSVIHGLEGPMELQCRTASNSKKSSVYSIRLSAVWDSLARLMER